MNVRLTMTSTTALAACLIVGTPSVEAAEAASSDSRNAPMQVAATGLPATSDARAADGVGVPPLEAGVRKAAAQGPTALRRYVHRTQTIYGYSYRDFEKFLPRE